MLLKHCINQERNIKNKTKVGTTIQRCSKLFSKNDEKGNLLNLTMLNLTIKGNCTSANRLPIKCSEDPHLLVKCLYVPMVKILDGIISRLLKYEI